MADDDQIKSFVSAFVKKDMKDHPECQYSLSSQKECSSNNGSFACETIRRVFRNCPGLRPEQVYDITTRDTGTLPKSPGGSGGSGGIPGIPVLGGRASQKPHGGSPTFVPPDDWPLGRNGIDDLLGSLHDRINGFFKDNPFAGAEADFKPFDGFGGFGGFGGGGGGGSEGGGIGVGGPSADAGSPPRVPPPHKHQQSNPAKGEPGAGKAAKDDSVVARA